MLTYIGDSVSQSEQVDIIHEGLPTEFESTVTFIYNKSKPMSVDEVESLLLTHELRLGKLNKNSLGTVNLAECNSNSMANSNYSHSQMSTVVNSDPQVHLTQASSSSTHNSDDYNGANCFNNSVRGGGRNFFHGGRGGGRGKYSNVQCQVCHKFGHESSFCYIIGMMKTMFPLNL